MRSQIGGVAQAQRNAQDGVSLVQTAEGALTEVHSMLQRVRDLKVQSENGTLNTDDKGAIEKEVIALGKEIGDIASQTKFNGIGLLDGGTASVSTSMTVRVPRLDRSSYTPGVWVSGTKRINPGAIRCGTRRTVTPSRASTSPAGRSPPPSVSVTSATTMPPPRPMRALGGVTRTYEVLPAHAPARVTRGAITKSPLVSMPPRNVRRSMG